jgi:hypothetical protein
MQFTHAGKKQQESEDWSGGLAPAPATAPYKCSNSTNDVCRFPFKLHGDLHWDCVERDGTPVCNSGDPHWRSPEVLQSFNSTATFQPCAKCASCLQEGTVYDGFRLSNAAGTSDYYGVTSSEECQALCQLVTGCNFFYYLKRRKMCSLQYGVGRKVIRPNVSFGPKQCSTNSAGNTSSLLLLPILLLLLFLLLPYDKYLLYPHPTGTTATSTTTTTTTRTTTTNTAQTTTTL